MSMLPLSPLPLTTLTLSPMPLIMLLLGNVPHIIAATSMTAAAKRGGAQPRRAQARANERKAQGFSMTALLPLRRC